MKYSIILPVRNGGHHVKTCIKSILTQTHTDFNCIVLDNCSTDGTKEWIESVKDKRIKLITAEKPLSIEESWARITTVDKNEFITIIGHDDVLYPDFLLTIDELINQNPAASLYLTHFDLIDASGKLIRHCKPMSSVYNGDELLRAILINSIDIVGSGYVMRAKDYDQIGGIPTRYPSLLYADFELWLNLANIKFEAIAPVNCFAFRIHQSTTYSSSNTRLLSALDMFVNYLSSLLINDNFKLAINHYGSAFLIFSCRGFCHRLLRTRTKDREGVTVKKVIAHSKIWARQLGVDDKYHPEKLFSIKVAEIIDSNALCRQLFLFFKKLFPKPVIKK